MGGVRNLVLPRSEYVVLNQARSLGIVAAYMFIPSQMDQSAPDFMGRYPLQFGQSSGLDTRDPAVTPRGLVFSGDDYLSLGSRMTEVLEYDRDFAVAVTASTTATATQDLFSRSTGVRLILSNNSASFQTYNGVTNNTGLASNLGYSDGQPRMYIGVWDSSNRAAEIYVDGNLRGRTANMALNTGLLQTANVFVGCLSGSAVFFNGTIHSMYIINQRVHAQRATWLYRMERQLLARRGVMLR